MPWAWQWAVRPASPQGAGACWEKQQGWEGSDGVDPRARLLWVTRRSLVCCPGTSPGSPAGTGCQEGSSARGGRGRSGWAPPSERPREGVSGSKRCWTTWRW